MMNTFAIARVRTWCVREERHERSNDSAKVSGVRIRFPLGRLFVTPGVLSLLADLRDTGKPYSVLHAAQADDPMSLVLPYVRRHASGDWGDVNGEDWSANDQALRIGGRLFSAYQLPTRARLWIITEADRSSTPVLRPDEY